MPNPHLRSDHSAEAQFYRSVIFEPHFSNSGRPVDREKRIFTRKSTGTIVSIRYSEGKKNENVPTHQSPRESAAQPSKRPAADNQAIFDG